MRIESETGNRDDSRALSIQKNEIAINSYVMVVFIGSPDSLVFVSSRGRLNFLPLECGVDLFTCFQWIDDGGSDNGYDFKARSEKALFLALSFLDHSLGGEPSCHVVRMLKQMLSR